MVVVRVILFPRLHRIAAYSTEFQEPHLALSLYHLTDPSQRPWELRTSLFYQQGNRSSPLSRGWEWGDLPKVIQLVSQGKGGG